MELSVSASRGAVLQLRCRCFVNHLGLGQIGEVFLVQGKGKVGTEIAAYKLSVTLNELNFSISIRPFPYLQSGNVNAFLSQHLLNVLAKAICSDYSYITCGQPQSTAKDSRIESVSPRICFALVDVFVYDIVAYSMENLQTRSRQFPYTDAYSRDDRWSQTTFRRRY